VLECGAVALDAGSNSILLSNASAYAPDVDRIIGPAAV
jgi:hypothetical protein